MPASGADEPNGRVSNAEIRKDIQHLTNAFNDARDETRRYRDRNEDRLRNLEDRQARCDEQALGFQRDIAALHREDECLQVGVDQAKEGVVDIRVHSNRWDVLTGLIAAAAGGIAGVFGNK
jgi:hypothetical protein